MNATVSEFASTRSMAGPIERLLHVDDSTQRRIFMTYLLVRAGLGLALLLAQTALDWLAHRGMSWILLVCLAYAAQAVFWWLWPGRVASRSRVMSPLHWWATIGVDVLTFGSLHGLNDNQPLNFGALLVLPVLMAGVLGKRRSAWATAAVVSLLLLATALHRAIQTGDFAGQLPQAGMGGIGIFVIALVAAQLASRLASGEQATRGSLALARQQAELNRLVIEEMHDGVLVVDEQGMVRAANPAARILLADDGSCPEAPFLLTERTGWRTLHEAVRSAYETGQWPEGGLDLSLEVNSQLPRQLRVRARFTRGARLGGVGKAEGHQGVLAVLFAEDLRKVLLRQKEERLVAMGRISAGIAHEIRNPLAAVAQANALLQEDVLRPDQQRLTRIVADNVDRLKRIVNDVLEAAPGGRMPARWIDGSAEVSAIVAEWAQTVGLQPGPSCRVSLELPAYPLHVAFDPEHLRRVLVNLLENGLRHATGEPGAVLVTLEPLDGTFVKLAVASDGALIPPEVEAHLFEPFHSTSSRGTGLGLYICRELCSRHHAQIDYVQRPGVRHGNLFHIVMQADLTATEPGSHP